MNRILAIVAHPDDEVLGCGAALAKHAEAGDEVRVAVLTDGELSRSSSDPQKRRTQLERACEKLGAQELHWLSFEDQKLDTYPFIEITEKIRKIKRLFRPNVVYTHSLADINLDHQITAKASFTVFRPFPGENISKLLSFEVPSSGEWSPATGNERFAPNYFVTVTKQQIEKKIAALSLYSEEIQDFPHPRSAESILALAKHRGTCVGAEFAEAFAVERIIQK